MVRGRRPTALTCALRLLVLFQILLPACGGTLKVGIVPTTDRDTAGATPLETPSPAAPVATSSSPSPSAIAPPSDWPTYSTDVFRVSLRYPPDWRSVDGYGDAESGATRYAGDGGFFHVAAMGADTIDDAATTEAEHHLRPYGSQPIIENTLVQGREARLILPSADQPAGMDRQAALIVRYPAPVEIGGQTYEYLVLWADEDHVRAIGQTVGFGDGASPRSTPTPRPLTFWEKLPPGLVYTTSEGLWLIDSGEVPRLVHNDPQAVLSPDGRRVVTYDAIERDLWLLGLGEGTILRLTNTPDRYECCALWWPENPDTVLFTSAGTDEGQTGEGAGYPSLVRTDGSGYQVLDPEHLAGSGRLAPSTDGETVAYADGGAGWLYRAGRTEAFDPADRGLVVAGGLRVANPAWSPDGSKLAWVVKGDLDGNGQSQVGLAIFDLVSDASAAATMVLHAYEPQGTGWPASPVWSPDGGWLVLGDSSASERAGLWVVNIDGQEEYHLGMGGWPVWSPGGDWIAFQSLVHDGPPAYMVADVATWEVRRLSLLPDRYGRLVDWIRLDGAD